ncbi:MAG: hypothetical protein D6E12_06125, partial [Desulfovibrio sp.]
MTLLFFLLALAHGVGHAQTGAEDPPRILILHSYHKGYRWTDNIMSGIDEVFQEALPEAELYVEYLDTKRHHPSRMFPHHLDAFRDKYQGAAFDVILTSDDNALTFLLMVREELFPATPVVFCGINDVERYEITQEKGFTGVVEDFDLRATLDAALAMHPETRHILAISDSTPSSLANYERLVQIAPEYEDRVEFTYMHDVAVGELLDALHGLGPDSIIMHMNFFRDRDGLT